MTYSDWDRLVGDGGTDVATELGPDESTIEALVRGVAVAKGVAATDLDPLYRSVDPDALEALCQHADGRGARLQVTFTYEGCRVTVDCGGQIQITIQASPDAIT